MYSQVKADKLMLLEKAFQSDLEVMEITFSMFSHTRGSPQYLEYIQLSYDISVLLYLHNVSMKILD